MSSAANPLVSVVIPAFKRTDGLRSAVRSLFHQDLSAESFEVLVVDSSPDSANRQAIEELQADAPFRLQFLHKEPEGPGPSRNLGAHHARGAILAFLDSDCQASPEWLRAGLAAFEPRTGLVQGRTSPDPAGELGVFVHTVIVDKESHIYETCNMFYRREAFEQVGGFPSDRDLDAVAEHPMGGEDIELAWKVKRQGWNSCFASEAVVYHEVRPIPLIRWLYSKHMMIWPRVVGRYPEIRRYLYAWLFYDQAQALFSLGLVGFALIWISPWFLVLT
ncbi:MAG: glycosyltransferase, partial [Planctomycetales bacterium]